MGGLRNSHGSMTVHSAKTNGISNGITNKNGRDFYVNNSPFRNHHSDENKDKITCSLVVTLHKNGNEQSSLTKTFVQEPFYLNLSPEEFERMKFQKMSFDLEAKNLNHGGGQKFYEGEGINKDENGNACKPLSKSNLHFDWSRFETLPKSLRRNNTNSTKLWKYLSVFVVLLGVIICLLLSLSVDGKYLCS